MTRSALPGCLALVVACSAQAFEPTNLTGCVLWLQADAANIQTNNAGGRVSQWSDLSGAGNHATQADTNRQPLYVESGPNGHPTLFFDVRYNNSLYGAKLLTSTALTNACTAFIVSKVVDAGELGFDWRRILGSRDKNWCLGTYTPGTFYAHGHSGELSGLNARLKASYQFNRTYTLSFMNNTTSQFFYVNGFDLTGNPANKTPPGRLGVGGSDISGDTCDSLISEVVAYDRALTAEERQQVEGYLKARYGVTDEGFAGPVWSGAGASSLWSDGANWQQAMPAAPMLAFSANSRLNSTNDLTGLILDSVMVWDLSWTFSGNPVTLNNGFFCNPAGTATWGLDTALTSGPHTFSVRTDKRLTLSGALSGAGGLELGLGKDFAGTLALACPSNTFTGPVRLKGGTAEITRLANAGQPSSLGAASSADATVLLGNRRMSHSGGLRYVGSESGATDRPFAFVRLSSVENASPAGAGLSFSGAWAAADAPGAGPAYLSLGGTAAGVNRVNAGIANAPGGANSLSVTVKGGVWAFSLPSTYTGDCVIEGGTVLANAASAGCLGAGRVKLMPGGTLGGTGLVTSAGGAVLQYAGATLSPGDPAVNGGIGCLTYGTVPGLSGVRLVCQATAETNDSVRINGTVSVPGFMAVELVAASAQACPDSVRVIEADGFVGATDLSGWEIVAPCAYRAVREGNAIVLQKQPLTLGAWQRSMPVRFKGYEGSTTLTNFPALIKLSDGCGNNRFHYSDCEAGGADLLFTDASGTELQHEIDTWNTNGESHVWVQIPALAQGTQITAHWKNPARATDANLFVPTDLPDCGLWLHAGAGADTNASGFVSSWADQSGNGLGATQGNPAYQPVWVPNAVNGQPAVRFEGTGSEDSMATGWRATNTPYSVFVAGAFRLTAGYTWRRIVQGSAGYNWGIALDSPGTFYTFVASDNQGHHTTVSAMAIRPAHGTPFVGSLIGDGTNSQASLNGFAYPSVTGHGGPNLLNLGSNTAGGHSGDGWQGDVLEVIAYDRALSPSERQQVERYLALKYDALSAHRVPAVGLRQWFRGDTVNADVMDGATPRVSKCENQTDLAALMHATQTVTNRMPERVSASFNNKPALRFDAVSGQYDGLKSFATPIGKAYSVIAVYSTRATDAVERVALQGAGSVSRLGVAGGVVTRRANGVVSQLLPCQTNTPVIAAMLCNEVTSSFYVNGVNLTQNSAPAAAWGTGGSGDNSLVYFGAGTADGALDLPLDGDLAEVLVYDRVISDTERRRIEAYLAGRYAIPVEPSNTRVWSGEFGGVWHLNAAGRLVLADATAAQNGAALLGQAQPAAESALAGQGVTWNLAAQMGRTRTQPATAQQTFSFWIKQSDAPVAQATVLAGTNGLPYAALNNAGGHLQVAGTDAAALAAPTTGAWTHYAVVVNAPGQSVQAYGNGVPLATVPAPLAQSLPAGQALTFGHAPGATDGTKTFAGVLDEVRLETVSRSADWILAAYLTQAENDRFTSYNRWGTLLRIR